MDGELFSNQVARLVIDPQWFIFSVGGMLYAGEPFGSGWQG
jgi:hypothetical protein